jgi:hypothetical protein
MRSDISAVPVLSVAIARGTFEVRRRDSSAAAVMSVRRLNG